MTWHWGSSSSPGWLLSGCKHPPLPLCCPPSPFSSSPLPLRAVSLLWNWSFGCQHQLFPRSSPATCAPNPELWYPASCHLEIDTKKKKKKTNYGKCLKRETGWRMEEAYQKDRNWKELAGSRKSQLVETEKCNAYFLPGSNKPCLKR